MAPNNINNRPARMLAMLAVMFAIAGLLGPAPGATARTVKESTAPTPTASSATPNTSVQTGKLDVYLTDYWTGEPLAAWGLAVEDLGGHQVAYGLTDSTGFYGVLIPAGEYLVGWGALPSWCVGFHAEVTIVANQTTTVRGQSGLSAVALIANCKRRQQNRTVSKQEKWERALQCLSPSPLYCLPEYGSQNSIRLA